MNIVDSILGTFGLVRNSQLRPRSSRTFDAAAINRLTADWVSSMSSIDQAIRGGIVVVRERARDLAKNNDLVRRYLNLCKVNIVGPVGFKLQMNVSERIETKEKGAPATFTIVQDSIANTKIEEAWKDWQRPENCHVAGRLSFRQLCNQVVEYRKRDGEAFLRMVPRKKSKYGMQLQVIPPEAVDDKYNATLPSGNVVKMGIELDQDRRPVAYYVKQSNSELELYGIQSFSYNYIRIPAVQIIHYFRQDFENQSRGISEMVQSMLRLKMLAGYEEAAVINARASAAKMGFFETPADQAPSDYKGNDVDAAGNTITSSEPGLLEKLPVGMKFAPWSPEYPSAQHEMFIKTTTKIGSAGLNVAYASLTNDLSEANYGSNRVGLLDERAMWMMEQQDVIEQILDRVFAEWLLWALGTSIALPPEKYDKFNKPTWSGRRWPWIDPLKDMAATALALKLYMTSHYDEIGAMGKDPEEILQDQKSFKELVEKYGFTFNLGDVQVPSMPANSEDVGKGSGQDATEEKAVFDFVSRLLSAQGNGKH